MSVLWEPTLDDSARHWRDIARDSAATHFAPLAEELDRDQRYPYEHIKTFVETGLASMLVPSVYGGNQLSMTAITAITEVVSAACASTGAILAAQTLGAVPLLLAGNDDQRQQYLSQLPSGAAMSFALTEVGAGSDAAAITTVAVADGDDWVIDGEKVYIGNGGISSAYVVFAKTDPAAGARGISAFLVEADAPGVTIDRFEDKMGIRGTRTSNMKLAGVRVAGTALLGQLGRGLKLALQTLDVGRITVSAQGLGIAYAAFELAAREANRRTTFGKPLIENQGISFRLADLAVEISAARMLTYDAAAAYDRGESVSLPGAKAKLYTSEVAHRAVDLAVQVYGGDGYCKPCPAERLYRDQRVLEIYEGASEIQRIVLSRAIATEFANV